jgi:hypothetical protein
VPGSAIQAGSFHRGHIFGRPQSRNESNDEGQLRLPATQPKALVTKPGNRNSMSY